MQCITPFLLFDGQAEDAMNFWVGIFKNSKVLSITGPKGKAFSVAFELDGLKIYALNGGPKVKFSAATSFFVGCETQEEVDSLWTKLTEGGEEQPCGWLKDKFGVSWQVVPSLLSKLCQDQDRTKSSRVVAAMMKMKKIDMAGLQAAFDGA